MLRLRPRPAFAAVAAFALIVALVLLNRWVFCLVFGTEYLVWYLQTGVVISLASGLIASAWDDAEARFGLISQNPAVFVGSCFRLLGIFVSSLSPARRGRGLARPAASSADDRLGLDSPPAAALDEFFYGLLALLLLLLGLGWLVVAAPLTYFVNLVAGVPARQGLRARLAAERAHAGRDARPAHAPAEDDGRPAPPEADGESDRARTAVPHDASAGLSFARDPFAVTQAMAALILWLGGLAYDKLR